VTAQVDQAELDMTVDVPVATELPPFGRALKRAAFDVEELARLRETDGPILIRSSHRCGPVDAGGNVRLEVCGQTLNRSTVFNRYSAG
jgi:hypothetical protein